MDVTGKIGNITRDLRTGKIKLEIETDMTGMGSELEELLHLDKLSISMKKYRKHRSLDANAYAWQLMSKLADKTNASKEEVYELMLQRYGTPEVDENNIAVVISLLENINTDALNLHLFCIGRGHVNGKSFKHYRVIKGSSEYDTKEMATFIDGIIYECKQMGIETLPPEELARMMMAWQRNQ